MYETLMHHQDLDELPELVAATIKESDNPQKTADSWLNSMIQIFERWFLPDAYPDSPKFTNANDDAVGSWALLRSGEMQTLQPVHDKHHDIVTVLKNSIILVSNFIDELEGDDPRREEIKKFLVGTDEFTPYETVLFEALNL